MTRALGKILLSALMVRHDLSDDPDFDGKRDRLISITPAGLGSLVFPQVLCG
jgi:hypothetical protein